MSCPHGLNGGDCVACLRARVAALEAELSSWRGGDAVSMHEHKARVAELEHEAAEHTRWVLLNAVDKVRLDMLDAAVNRAIDVLSPSESYGPDPDYQDHVNVLGREIGFGALMAAASFGWRQYLERRHGLVGGEHTVGPCRTVLDGLMIELRAARKEQ